MWANDYFYVMDKKYKKLFQKVLIKFCLNLNKQKNI